MKQVIIMSGISGSGKSTLAMSLIKSSRGVADIVSADHFFTDNNGSYSFDASKLGQAHGSCVNRFKELIEIGADLIIVDNTSCSTREIKGYANLAKAAGYDFKVVTVRASVETAHARNSHQVPIEVVKGQFERLSKRELPADWATEEVYV